MKNLGKFILSCIWGPLLLAQILLMFVFGVINDEGNQVIKIAGYFAWFLSAVFGWLPIHIFKRRGGVEKGKSYVHTSLLVDTGLYAIVRHPQYTAGILLCAGLILISQTWIVAAIGLVCIALMYWDIVMADKHEIQKFGDQYKQYMVKVPRTNFLLGIIRILKRNLQRS